MGISNVEGQLRSGTAWYMPTPLGAVLWGGEGWHSRGTGIKQGNLHERQSMSTCPRLDAAASPNAANDMTSDMHPAL